MNLFKKLFGDYSSREIKKIEPLKNEILGLEEKYSSMSEADLKNQTNILKKRLADGETADDILTDAFAVCREASWRVLGMKHFPVQVVGGVVLHQGRIAEMRTGEGKTLVATLPAYLNGLTGEGVHIVTVNDYLAKRDSEWMGKVYRYLGLTVGLIIHGVDNAGRRNAYNSDITYGTNNEYGFDYLRDNMVKYKEQRVQRDHKYCIVDEVDSILIDEARTPLIISGPGEKSSELYKQADRFAKRLVSVRIAELDAKEDEHESHKEDYIIDEKAKTATLTPVGIKKAENFFNVDNLMDADNSELQHHINQAIKANGVMTRDIDYVVKDGEIIIVDEFTGRLMIGRRYNEGLHQAIEAKENVEVARESKTLATITFQNYFRLYNKLAGMTGTALTEENEFREIYNLDCIEIPTNKPPQRTDHDDLVFQTERGKFSSLVEKIKECNEKGQPVLVGTVSIEKSEYIGSLLKRQGIPHSVLNAKNHKQEAEIVAQAGQIGAVTIATNMAGRGTDISLGGNAEFMATRKMQAEDFSDDLIEEAKGFAETSDQDILNARKKYSAYLKDFADEINPKAQQVKDTGGLFIIGTERHESRRIDNQLRGRAGRQGDPGETQFFLSLEDDLLRLFNAERVSQLMTTFKIDEDVPIDSRMLTSILESAQAKVEGRNFSTRKSVLKFDDVLSLQREIIYGQRNMVLDDADLKEYVEKMIDSTIEDTAQMYLGISEDEHDDPKVWNITGLRDHYYGWVTKDDDLKYTDEELETLTREDVISTIQALAHKIHEDKEKEYGAERMRELERVILLRFVDEKWMDHIDAMDQLKQGIYLRSYGQQNPVDAYRIEGADMFDEMIESIKEDTVKLLMLVQIKEAEEPKREQTIKPSDTGEAGSAGRTVKNTGDKVGRNDPCPCGSGKKYKHCHGK